MTASTANPRSNHASKHLSRQPTAFCTRKSFRTNKALLAFVCVLRLPSTSSLHLNQHGAQSHKHQNGPAQSGANNAPRLRSGTARNVDGWMSCVTCRAHSVDRCGWVSYDGDIRTHARESVLPCSTTRCLFVRALPLAWGVYV